MLNSTHQKFHLGAVGARPLIGGVAPWPPLESTLVRSIVISLFACLLAYLRNHTVDLHTKFCAFPCSESVTDETTASVPTTFLFNDKDQLAHVA